MPRNPKNPEVSKEDQARQKQMEAVAKHLRFNVSCKSAVIKGQKVEYFTSSKAVDCLMASKWTKLPEENDDITPYFPTRSDAVKYCTKLLQRQFFIRANKVEVKPKGEEKEKGGGAGAERKGGKQGETTRKREGKATDSPRAKKQEKEAQEEEGKKKKKKYRLETHQHQVFLDSDDIYYWQFDPPSRGTYVIGFAVVLGAIAVTLQPLWPDSTRVGLWYLSMALFATIGILIGVIVVRWFLFGLVVIFTTGKIHFWILPNLDNEKCDFFQSFLPLYSVEVRTSKKGSKKKKTSEASSSESKAETSGGLETEAVSDDQNEQSSSEEAHSEQGVGTEGHETADTS